MEEEEELEGGRKEEDGENCAELEDRSDAEAERNDYDAYNHLGFMLVGHGVPYLLFQDHVDCAWDMLNEFSPDGGGGYGSTHHPSHEDDSKRIASAWRGVPVDDSEVVECSFSNDDGKLSFEWYVSYGWFCIQLILYLNLWV